MSIKISSRKQKARLLQQWACKKISELTGIDWGKDAPIESRPMGQSGCDVRMEGAVLQKFPYSVECKAQENWSVKQWMEQAKENLIPNTNWLLIVKSSRREPIVIMDANHFFELLKKGKIDPLDNLITLDRIQPNAIKQDKIVNYE